MFSLRTSKNGQCRWLTEGGTKHEQEASKTISSLYGVEVKKFHIVKRIVACYEIGNGVNENFLIPTINKMSMVLYHHHLIFNKITANHASGNLLVFKHLAIMTMGKIFTKNNVKLTGKQKEILPLKQKNLTNVQSMMTWLSLLVANSTLSQEDCQCVGEQWDSKRC